ncbi:MAG: Trk system potassium transporter TrkA [Gammaproteobacteria bacterium]|nr:Trk system potassium transporter TrkA [Gammaproteobacteria bacterium]
MHIVILGAGQVGGTLAELLNDGTNNLSVVDIDNDLIRNLEERLEGIHTTVGNAALPSTLEQANMASADMLVAVTGSDEINIVAAQVARSAFGTQKVIARIRAAEYPANSSFSDDFLQQIRIINPEAEVTRQIEQLLLHQNALQVHSFADDLVSCVSFKAVAGREPTGQTVDELFSYRPLPNVRFLAVYRGYEPIAANTDTVQEGDELFAMTPSQNIDATLQLCTENPTPSRKICIAGGGHIGAALAEQLQESHIVRVIEYSKSRAVEAARMLKDGVVYVGDATDVNKLKECEISDTDLFCSVTNDDEINVMSCLLAKQHGTRRTVALLSKDSYLRLIHGTTIDAGISPQRSTVSSILTHVREQNVKSAHRLRIGDAEILEIEIAGERGQNRVVGKSVSQIKLPKDAQLAAVVRNKSVLDLDSNPQLEMEDHVVIFVGHSGQVPSALKPFRASQFLFL